MIGWEVLFDLLFVNLIFLLFQKVIVICSIPALENCLGISSILPLKILQKCKLLLAFLEQLQSELLFKILHIDRIFGHPDL